MDIYVKCNTFFNLRFTDFRKNCLITWKVSLQNLKILSKFLIKYIKKQLFLFSSNLFSKVKGNTYSLEAEWLKEREVYLKPVKSEQKYTPLIKVVSWMNLRFNLNRSSKSESFVPILKILYIKLYSIILLSSKVVQQYDSRYWTYNFRVFK